MQERDLRSLDPLSQRRGPLPEVRGVVRPGFAESRERRRHPREGKCRRAAQGAEVQPGSLGGAVDQQGSPTGSSDRRVSRIGASVAEMAYTRSLIHCLEEEECWREPGQVESERDVKQEQLQ